MMCIHSGSSTQIKQNAPEIQYNNVFWRFQTHHLHVSEVKVAELYVIANVTLIC